MSKVTFTTESIVLVTIKRDKNKNNNVRKGDDLIHRLFDFLKDQQIRSAYPSHALLIMVDDKWEQFFTVTDAKKVKNWLLGQGVEFEKQ